MFHAWPVGGRVHGHAYAGAGASGQSRAGNLNAKAEPLAQAFPKGIMTSVERGTPAGHNEGASHRHVQTCLPRADAWLMHVVAVDHDLSCRCGSLSLRSAQAVATLWEIPMPTLFHTDIHSSSRRSHTLRGSQLRAKQYCTILSAATLAGPQRRLPGGRA